MTRNRLVLAVYSLVRLAIPFLGGLLLLAGVTWAGAANDFWLAEESRRETVRIFIIITCTAGFCFLTFMELVRFVWHGGAGIYLLDGKLHVVGQGHSAFAPSEVTHVSLGRETVFEGVPGTITFHLATGRRRTVQTYGLATPVPEILAGLERCGVSIARDEAH